MKSLFPDLKPNGFCDTLSIKTQFLIQRRDISVGHELVVDGDMTQYNTTDNAEYEFAHDMYGNLMHSVLPANLNGERLGFTYTYDSIIHTYPVRVQNESLGYYSSAEYDLRFGKPSRTTDINGNEMRYEYDETGRTVKITAPNELADSLPYTIRMRYMPHRTHLPVPENLYSCARTDHYDRSHPDDPISTVLICDGWGRLLQTKKDAEISGLEKSIVTGKVTYDCFGRTISQYHPVTQDTADYSVYDTNYDPLTLTETHYDILDRQTKVKLPNGDSTTTAYGFGTAPADNRNCLRTTVTDPKHYTVTTLTEGRGLQMATIAPYNTVTSFVYDPIGRLTSTTDPSNFTTTYSYDMLGRMTQRTHPDAGTDAYVYDVAGNMTQHTNGKGDVAQYAYYYNQLTDVSYPAYPANNVHYTYGAMGAAHNRAGKIVTQEDASGWQEFFYGKMGEVTKNIRTFALPYEQRTYTFAMEYKYDSQTINPRNSSCQHCNGNASVHFATPFLTVNCQLSTVNWMYTFSAKEKDTETGLSYFGSRYYSSDLSIWLSVDPMSDKYPPLSPYTYCANNPVKLVDPNGKDWFENELTGDVYYSEDYRKGDEKLIDGEGWKWMGENDMFGKTADEVI